MRRVFLDANVFIDLLKDRSIGDTGIREHLKDIYPHVYVSVLTIHIAFYVLKIKSGSRMHKKVLKLIKYVNILPLRSEIINLAISLSFPDFEDMLQYLSAIGICEYILTRDKKDFDKLQKIFPSEITVVKSVSDVLEK